MSLIKKNYSPLNVFSDLFEDEWIPTKFNKTEWMPAINVIENDQNFELEVAAPGFKKEDFTVAIENGLLTISGKTEKEAEEKEKNYTRKEFSSKSFSKSFSLPENVKEDAIAAKYEEGLLHLTLLKNKEVTITKKEVMIK